MSSLLWGKRTPSLSTYGVQMRGRSRIGSGRVTRKRAMQNSVVWASTRLRANLVSTLPIDVIKSSSGSSVPIQMQTPRVLTTPYEWAPDHPMSIGEFLYATQLDLDSEGNAFGIILERDGNRLPSRILPAPAADTTVMSKDGEIKGYLIGGTAYDPSEVWHERQYVRAGSPMGMSPIAHAAFSLEASVSAEDFALDWFRSGATPLALVTNSTKAMVDDDAEIAKRRWMATTSTGEPVVLGKDWTYTQISSTAKQSQFLERINASDVEIARFFDVAGDMIGVAVPGNNITYANITQRFLQFLVVSLAPTLTRREVALSRLTPLGRQVKFNTDAFLRMDPAQRNEQLRLNKQSRITTVTETRALLNLPPLTAAQKAEIAEDLALANTTPTFSPVN